MRLSFMVLKTRDRVHWRWSSSRVKKKNTILFFELTSMTSKSKWMNDEWLVLVDNVDDLIWNVNKITLKKNWDNVVIISEND